MDLTKQNWEDTMNIEEITTFIDDSNTEVSSECSDQKEDRSRNKKNYLRTVRRTGICNMKKKRRTTRISHFASDIFTSMVDSRWRNILLISTISFVSSWFLFALLWWVIAYAHGDLRISPYISDGEPCVTALHDLLTAFIYSLESQYTTGYGDRAPTTECPEAVFILSVQCVFGILFHSVLVGFVFTKICRPKGRIQAILFSENAVICLRDGMLCLMFRLADERTSHVIDCKLHAWYLQHEVSTEGEILLHHKKKIKVSVDEGGSEIFLLWPVTVVHRIDAESPLYNLSAEDLHTTNFEVVVSLVCTTETTGRPTEARCSYTPNEIQWGHRFQTMIKRNSDGLEADYSLFNNIEPVDTVICSSKRLFEKVKYKRGSLRTNLLLQKFPSFSGKIL